MENKVFVMAIGAHPDDVELGCAGTLLNHIKINQKVAIVDLTQGELGSRGTIDTRYSEAAAAKDIMGVHYRHNLKMEDGFFEHNRENVLKLVELIRLYKPELVIANAPSDRHPDHGRAGKLIRDAAFLSGLRKIETLMDGQPQVAWRPKKVFHYIQDKFMEPDFIVDISASMEQKMKAVEAYQTQFFAEKNDDEPVTYISTNNFLNKIRNRAAQLGSRIGVAYGEGFISEFSLGVKDLNDFIYPEFP
ncbi:MAG TPA: bacillithiol biosynthesis deacetylase BshB1 [Edaphocola sp.]|nr:bacillithiol biosynthesis deacetylase BshB1 [Edaphocola sp.]